jgi:imidazolonepropionase-like amidohydrolase
MATPSAATLFQNVRIFDGKSGALSAPSNVLVRANKIERISSPPIAVDRKADMRIVEGGGRTLMPGLIDAHWHTFLARLSPAQALDFAFNILRLRRSVDTPMRGFTTARDGRPARPRAIDAASQGKPIYPSAR